MNAIEVSRYMHPIIPAPARLGVYGRTLRGRDQLCIDTKRAVLTGGSLGLFISTLSRSKRACGQNHEQQKVQGRAGQGRLVHGESVKILEQSYRFIKAISYCWIRELGARISGLAGKRSARNRAQPHELIWSAVLARIELYTHR